MSTSLLPTSDVPQANDPADLLALARHMCAHGTESFPDHFVQPRHRAYYVHALQHLGALDADRAPTPLLTRLADDAEAARATFAEAFAASPIGRAWLAWAGASALDALDPAEAVAFLTACSALSESTAKRRASTLRQWLGFARSDTASSPRNEAPTVASEPDVSLDPPIHPTERASVAATSHPDPNRLLASLARDKVALHVDTVDLCFTAALHLRSERSAMPSLDEETLIDVFEQVCDLVDPAADNVRKRATHAIQRLRDARLLVRVDGAGIVRTGEYALTRLAGAIVAFFLADESLTRESLTLLTRTLLANFADILAAARRAGTPDEWHRDVVGPLRVTVGELVGGIERRQRGLDAQQEEVQRQIAELLHADWFGAVDQCQDLLETTTTTLAELNEVLLRDAQQLVALLQDMQALAAEAGAAQAEEAAGRVIEQIDRIAAWGSSRQHAWSDYYRYVHRFLRDVVRLDPDRALSQRLRDQIAGWADRPFSLAVASTPKIVLLRPVEARVERPPVTAPARDRERALEHVLPDDQLARLEDLVSQALDEGLADLATVTGRVLEQLAPDERFVAAGRVAGIVARLARVRSERERPWVEVDVFAVQDWAVRNRR